MSHDMLETLRTIDPAVLSDVVRQERRSPTFEITEWSVERLSTKGMINPDGLFLFKGQGRDEQQSQSWSVVLKILRNPGVDQDPHDLWYWKRELLALQSGFLVNLPARSIVAPRFYGMAEYEDSAWVWMEHIQVEHNPRWTVAEYALAAHQLGRLNGAYVTGTPLPDFPWLCKEHNRSWINTFPLKHAWESPVVQTTFPASMQERIFKLWEERERFFDALNRLPQTFSHFDFQRRNLFLHSRNNEHSIIAVDWAQCGYGALGAELAYLLEGTALLLEIEPDEIAELEPPVFEAYLAGLREMGWTGNSELVRLGYTAQAATLVGTVPPVGIAFWTSDAMQPRLSEQFDRSPEVFAATLKVVCEYGLNCADEARQLMDRLL
jgi:hypothetical protein